MRKKAFSFCKPTTNPVTKYLSSSSLSKTNRGVGLPGVDCFGFGLGIITALECFLYTLCSDPIVIIRCLDPQYAGQRRLIIFGGLHTVGSLSVEAISVLPSSLQIFAPCNRPMHRAQCVGRLLISLCRRISSLHRRPFFPSIPLTFDLFIGVFMHAN